MKTPPQIQDEEPNLNFSKCTKKAKYSPAEKCESFIEIKFEDRSNDFKERLTLLEIRLCGDLETNTSVPESDTCKPQSPESEAQSKLQQTEIQLPEVFEPNNSREPESDTCKLQPPETEIRWKPHGSQEPEPANEIHSSDHKNITFINQAVRKKKILIFMCNICKVKLKEKYLMLEHLKTHKDEKRFTCEICEAKFLTPGEAKKHVTTHSGDVPFVIIENEFADLVKLGRPTKIRHEMKEHECQICHAKFVHPDHLRVHLKIHSLEKPYTCAVCDSEFARKSDLFAHLSIHVINNEEAPQG